jgi:hypothetical protein
MAHVGRLWIYAFCRDLANWQYGPIPVPMPKTMGAWSIGWFQADPPLSVEIPEGTLSEEISYEYVNGSFTYRWVWTNTDGEYWVDVINDIVGEEDRWWRQRFKIWLNGTLISERAITDDAWLDHSQMRRGEDYYVGDDIVEGVFIWCDGIGWCGTMWELC